MTAANTRELCIMACVFCRDPQFWQWAEITSANLIASADAAKEFILDKCQVKSRNELDSSQAAAHRFHTLVRAPFLAWKERL